MKIRSNWIVPICAMLLMMVIGCGGGGSSTPTSYGATNDSSAGFFKIQTSTGPNTAEAWGNVQITGYANYNTVTCDVTTDSNCIADIGNVGLLDGALTKNEISYFDTNSNGEAYFYTEAQSAEWTLYANGAEPSGCTSTQSSFITPENSGNGYVVDIPCGSNPAGMIASPASCTYSYNTATGKVVINTCPTTVTLTFPSSNSSAALPTASALAVADYSDTGTNLAQSSITASSATSVNVPIPTTPGTTYLAVYSPTTNQLLGGAPFTYNYTVFDQPPAPCTNDAKVQSTVSPDGSVPCTPVVPSPPSD